MMRRILFTELRPRVIAMNPSDAFDANVETLNLLVSGKGARTSPEPFRLLRLTAEGRTETVRQFLRPDEALNPDYVINYGGSEAQPAFLAKIDSCSVPLGTVAQVNYGLKTGDDPKFISSEKKGRNPKRVIYGEDVHSYLYDWRGLWVNYVPKEMTAHRPTARPATRERFETVPKIL